MERQQTKILLADPQWLVRQALRALLDPIDHLSIVGEADSGEKALRIAVELKPDLVILEVHTPNLDGLEVIRKLCERCPSMRFLVFSSHDRSEYVMAALRAGASGYLLKNATDSEVLEAIEAVRSGRSHLAVDLLESMRVLDPAQSALHVPRLSRRQREVLELVSEGFSNETIAQRLGLSPRTVGHHRYHLMRKLKIQSVAGLVRYAIREGLVTP